MPSSLKNKIPHGHLSWTAMNLLERDPEQYRRQYMLGEKGFVNEAMGFGKDVADALQHKKGLTVSMRHIITFLPRYSCPEKKIEAVWKGIPLLGYIDTTTASLTRFREYKTGKTSWSQRKVDSLGQLIFYAAMIWLLKRKVPEIALDWIPTEYNEYGVLELTGEIRSFNRTPVTLAEVMAMLSRIERAVEKIQKLL